MHAHVLMDILQVNLVLHLTFWFFYSNCSYPVHPLMTEQAVVILLNRITKSSSYFDPLSDDTFVLDYIDAMDLLTSCITNI